MAGRGHGGEAELLGFRHRRDEIVPQRWRRAHAGTRRGQYTNFEESHMDFEPRGSMPETGDIAQAAFRNDDRFGIGEHPQ